MTLFRKERSEIFWQRGFYCLGHTYRVGRHAKLERMKIKPIRLRRTFAKISIICRVAEQGKTVKRALRPNLVLAPGFDAEAAQHDRCAFIKAV